MTASSSSSTWRKATLENADSPKTTSLLYRGIAAILVSNFVRCCHLQKPRVLADQPLQVTAVDSSLSSSAHLAIASHFNKTNVSTWPVNAFLVCSIAVQPLYASLSDSIGRRLIYLASTFVFLVGTVGAALAPSWTGLILARAVSGFAAAGMMTMGSVVMTDLVGVKKRGHYQSLNYVNYGAGSAYVMANMLLLEGPLQLLTYAIFSLGSVSGGIVVETLGWSYIYKLQLPFSLLALILVYLWIPSDTRAHEGRRFQNRPVHIQASLARFDWAGSALLVASLLCLVFVLGAGGNVLPWSSPFIMAALAAFAVLLYLLIRVEDRAHKPILPPFLVRFPFRNIMLNALLFSMINYAVMYNATFFFQAVRLESAGQASTHLAVPSIAFTAVSAVSGTTISRLGTPKPTLRVSQLLLLAGTCGLVVMATVLPAVGAPAALYNLCLALPALGVGMMAPSALLTLLSLTDHETHAVANGGFIMMRSLGVFAATSLSSATIQNTFRASERVYGTTEKRLKKLEMVRLNIDSLQTLEADIQSLAVRSYQLGFIVLFGLLVICALGIVFGFAGIPEGQLKESATTREADAVVELADLLDEDKGDQSDTASNS